MPVSPGCPSRDPAGAQVWDADPPEYYDPPGGLMSFRMDYGGLVNGSAPLRPDMQLPSFAGHFELVNHQLVQAQPGPQPAHVEHQRAGIHDDTVPHVFNNGL